MSWRNCMQRHGHLILALPPLLVMYIAGLFFEFSVDASNPLAEVLRRHLDAGVAFGDVHHFFEAKARYSWFSLALLAVVVPVIAAGISITLLLQATDGGQRRVLAAAGAVLVAALAVYVFSGSESPGQMIYGYTFHTLAVSGRFGEAFLLDVDRVVIAVNVLATVAPVIMLLSACSAAALSDPDRCTVPEFWAARMLHLKEVINVGSAYLVFGILHMGAWLHWPAVLMVDDAVAKVAVELSRAITIYWGVAFTLVIMAIYAPAAYVLHGRAKRLVAGSGEGAEGDRWLKEHALSLELGKQLPQLIVILGPFFAGPLSAALSGLVGLAPG